MTQQLAQNKEFYQRHIGTFGSEAEMLKIVNEPSLESLIDKTIPASIRSSKALNVPDAINESDIGLVKRSFPKKYSC
jgi:glycine dehydrogenase